MEGNEGGGSAYDGNLICTMLILLLITVVRFVYGVQYSKKHAYKEDVYFNPTWKP